MAWTERQWQAAMRKAGWKNEGQGGWKHTTTGAWFHAWTVTQWRLDKYAEHDEPRRGEAWFEFALNEQVPTEAPF